MNIQFHSHSQIGDYWETETGKAVKLYFADRHFADRHFADGLRQHPCPADRFSPLATAMAMLRAPTIKRRTGLVPLLILSM